MQIKYQHVIKQLDDYLEFTEKKYERFRESGDEASQSAYARALFDLTRRIKVGVETIAANEAHEGDLVEHDKRNMVELQQTVPPDRSEIVDSRQSIEQALSGQSLELFRSLNQRKHWMSFDSLRTEQRCWRNDDPSDETIKKGLERLRTKLGDLAARWMLEISMKARRVKLSPPEPQKTTE